MNLGLFILRVTVFFLFSWPTLYAASLGSGPDKTALSSQGFNGTYALQADGSLSLSMRDGSRITIGPGAQVNPQTIGNSSQPSLRRDAQSKVIFSADPQLILIYTFRYTRDGTGIFMTDPEDMVSLFRFDATGKIVKALFPNGKWVQFQ